MRLLIDDPSIKDTLAGVLAAFAILGLGTLTRQDDALPLYSTVLIVVALVCVLFAGLLGRPSIIVAESAIPAAFVGVAIIVARGARER
jgi:hypothetical protein